MHRKVMAGVLTTTAVGLGAVGVAWAAGGGGASRLDDGKDLLPQAKVTEQQAIAAAQTAASGALDEVDLEHAGGRLVFNVDVGGADVKVDSATGKVLRVDHDAVDWFAQDGKGAVWYFGEATQELDRQGRVTSTEGSWRAGTDGARQGVFMPAHPHVGQSFAQEHYVKGIGQVKEATLKGGDERAELVAFRRR